MVDDRGAAARGETGRTAVDGVDREQRTAWRRLAVLPGPIAPGLAAAVLGADVDDARRLLDALADRALVDRAEDGRYDLGEAQRSRAAEAAEIEKAEERLLARRATDWFVHSAVNANRAVTHASDHTLVPAAPVDGVTPEVFASTEAGRAWCETWSPDLVSWVRFASAAGLDRRAWELPVAWWDYLFLAKPWVIWRTAAKAALRTARAAEDLVGQGWMLHALGVIAIEETDWDRAADYLDEALRIRAEAGHDRELGWTLAAVSRAALDRNTIEGAPLDARLVLDRLDEAERAFTTSDCVDGLSHVWSYRAQVLHHLGREDEAVTAQLHAAELADQVDAPVLSAFTLSRMAEMRLALGDFDDAVTMADAAAHLAQRIGWLWCVVNARTTEGTAHVASGRTAEARRSWEAALTVALRLSDVRAEALERRLAELG
ncbi:tetratricopeptide (TPR) repeat protein [Actinoalloteichus hoggarensis]|uniref:Regulatory protein AfsR n=1 Tax=Actinoalloteichus hoggarensis TaxID=1470176 RepID=A0A221W1B0_9PSEU|nr:hypothetical protein [Actinoalloteichus hoggarensis]ASO19585.1 Regulatory protein AfsR [Actinoalloteichus hoggarensis]MBB5919708.1 tetratricopeptide (TPR) repeat protein [Actinoalloteichus hoggarensis]